jgi:hypothetical protein
MGREGGRGGVRASRAAGGSPSPGHAVEVVSMDGFTGFKTATAEEPPDAHVEVEAT